MAGLFVDGLALVQVGDSETGKWGYIDTTGQMVINPRFDSANSFSEGFAAMRIGDYLTGKMGFIDTTGQIVVTPQFVPKTRFSRWGHKYQYQEGLAAVRVADEDSSSLWGLHRHDWPDGDHSAVR